MNDALSALRLKREEIARAVERLKAEDAELANAEAVLSRLSRSGSVESPVETATKKGAPLSQRSLVIKALASCDPPWVKSGDIVKEVKERYGVQIPELSLRPLLSALKRERIIARSGRQVALTNRL